MKTSTRTRKTGRRVALALMLSAVSACAPYGADFRRAVADQPQPPTGPEGPWRGEWRSEANGHHGPLWCLVAATEAPGRHAFRYRAGWGMMSFGDYTHVAATKPDGRATIRFSGEMELPGGVGNYSVEGRVTPARFDARYRSDRGDHGVMSLSRSR
jgi:hypothetical protein